MAKKKDSTKRKLLIDTSAFLRLYDSNNETLEAFDKVLEFTDRMILSQQVYSEFKRNRVSGLRKLINEFDALKGTRGKHETELTRSIPELKGLRSAKKDLNEITDKVIVRLEAMIESDENDPVASRIHKLYSTPGLTMLPVGDREFKAAHRRKLLGNPPVSPDKTTIGDEVIWEGVLAHVKDDLIFLTLDRQGFEIYEETLREEFLEYTLSNLVIVETFSEAAKLLGGDVSPKLEAAEKRDLEIQIAWGKRGGGLFGSDSYSPYGGPSLTAGTVSSWDSIGAFYNPKPYVWGHESYFQRLGQQVTFPDDLRTVPFHKGFMCRACFIIAPEGETKCPRCGAQLDGGPEVDPK